MDKPRQRKQNELIIHSKRNWIDEVIIAFLTLFVWMYCVGVVFFFISALFDYNDRFISLIKIAFRMTNRDIRIFMYTATAIWLVFYIGLWLWKQYNKKRFGSLSRRKYPVETTKEELLALNLVSEEDYDLLQESKLVVFEKNPIRDLSRMKGQ